MQKIHKAISPNTGNFCFSGATEFGEYVFEIDLITKLLESVKSDYFLHGICYEKIESQIDSYLVSCNRTYLSQYKNETITYDYVSTSPYKLVNIFNGNNNFFYGQDLDLNQLIKFTINPFEIEWRYDLDINSDESNTFKFSKTNNFIFYCNSSGLFSLRDDGDVCTFIKNNEEVLENYDIGIDNFQNAIHTFAKLSIVSGQELDQSSSSSSSSTSSSSTSSSSSESSSSSIDSSSSSSSSDGTSSSSSSMSSSSTSSIDSSSSSSVDSSSSSSSGSSSSTSEGNSSSSSSSEGYSSSSSSDNLLNITTIGLGWETRGKVGSYTPDWDYDDISTSITGLNSTLLRLQHLSDDSSSLPAYRIKIQSGSEIVINFVDGSASDFMYPILQNFKIYKNGTQIDSILLNPYSNYTATYTGLAANDIIDIRFIHSTSSMDIYNYEIHGDGRIRAKLIYLG